MSEPMSSSAPIPRGYGDSIGHEPSNLGDILERVLDKGLVIAGDIRVSLLDIELLTVKLRLLIASVETARQLGIDWWESDPFLSSASRRRIEAGERPAAEVTAEPVGEDRVRLPSGEVRDVHG